MHWNWSVKIFSCPSWLPLHLATNLFQHAIQNKVLYKIFKWILNYFWLNSVLKMILGFCLHMKFCHINFVKSFIEGWWFWNWKIRCISVAFGPVWLFAWHRVTFKILIVETLNIFLDIELCLAPFENHTELQEPNHWQMDILGPISRQNGPNQGIKST